MVDNDDSGLVAYHHERAGFWLALPPDWELVEDFDGNTAVAAVEPDEEQGFRANVVVTIVNVPDGMDHDEWQSLNDDANADQLTDYLLLDAERLEQQGYPVDRRLAQHTVPEAVPVTIQQWSTMRGQLGYTLTASVESLSMQHTVALFDLIADRFTIDEES